MPILLTLKRHKMPDIKKRKKTYLLNLQRKKQKTVELSSDKEDREVSYQLPVLLEF